MSKIIFPSYDLLPQCLKSCFLYMGIFPRDYVFSRSKLVDMWIGIAKGFLEPNVGTTLEDYATKCLLELISHSLVMACGRNINFYHEIHTCHLHSSLWHFIQTEVRKNKFFNVLERRVHSFQQHLKGQRGLSVHNNVLLGVREVHCCNRRGVHGHRTFSPMSWSFSSISDALVPWFEVSKSTQSSFDPIV